MPAPVYVHRHRVRFHETDLAGIVHFSNFFRMMEEAEHAFFRSIGESIHPPQQGTPIRQGWPRVRAACDFHAPLFFEEEIDIEVYLTDIRPRSLRYEMLFWKHPEAPLDQRVKSATGELVVVRVEANAAARSISSVPFSDELRAKLTTVVAQAQTAQTAQKPETGTPGG
jgi:acyl-CoA thioester hydrolase